MKNSSNFSKTYVAPSGIEIFMQLGIVNWRQESKHKGAKNTSK